MFLSKRYKINEVILYIFDQQIRKNKDSASTYFLLLNHFELWLEVSQISAWQGKDPKQNSCVGALHRLANNVLLFFVVILFQLLIDGFIDFHLVKED